MVFSADASRGFESDTGGGYQAQSGRPTLRRLVWIVLTALAVSAGALLSSASAGTARPLVGNEWSRIPTRQRVVALTFDCGNNTAGLRKILQVLADRHAAATFFLTGKWSEAYPGQASQIAARYPVGNHTYSHPHLARESDAVVRAEITRGERVIRSITGAATKPLFRFPYLDRNQRTIALAGSLGYGSIAWTVATLGSKGRSAGGTPAIVARVVSQLQPGEIVLMHVGTARDGSTPDANALPALIQAIAARGYGFTTLTDYTGSTREVVDDATTSRFSASASWGHRSSSRQRYRSGYHYAEPAPIADPARFKAHIPRTGSYILYARWAAAPENNSSAPFGISTIRGTRWVRVDQRRDGGRWVYLGSYRLHAGDHYLIQLSRRTSTPGLLIADAVRIAASP